MVDLGGALIGHMCGDYIFQGQYLADNKTKRLWVAAVHAAIWTSFVAIMGSFPLRAHGAIAFLFVTHWLIDRYRIPRRAMTYMDQEAFATGPFAPWSAIVVDNSWHLATIWIAARFMVP